VRNVQSIESVFVNFKAVYIGDHGTGLWYVIAMEDVTQQLKIQEEQKIARKQLYKSARLASIGTLASGVAHEMNNPLTAILGFSSAIMDRVANHEIMEQSELEQYLQVINVEALRCRDIVENLSRFAREGGEYMAASVSTAECSNNAIKLIHAKLVKSKIFIDNLLGDDCMVAGDATKIEQVFVNILTNCIDFCDQGSVVKMATTTSRDDSRFYSICISDNGPGIPPDILPKVFDPFFTTKEVGRGTGMGLAICHRIMEELNGSIDIVNNSDRGVSVVLEFMKK
jgi:signal transduction histidine kinase